MKKRVVRMGLSSIQLADSPVGALAHGGIQIWGLAKSFKMRGGFAVMPLHQLVNQRYLHQRRLLVLQSIRHAGADLRLPSVTAERIERRQTNIHAWVVAQGVQERRKHF